MTLIWRPGYGGAAVSDPDAMAYLRAVEEADNQPLEQGVQQAVNQFVIGCKADGIWDAIKASCILAGARTLDGALVPLVGTAPTNYNFVSGDYDRGTGLVGDGSTKYLDSNRLDNADPQNNSHRSIFIHTAGSNGPYDAYIGIVFTSPLRLSYLMRATDVGGRFLALERSSNGSQQFSGAQNSTGFVGTSRQSSVGFEARINGGNTSFTVTSSPPVASSNFVFARNLNGSVNSIASGRLAFYSIGESLDLAALDTRVSDLITAIGAAIP